MQVQAGFKTCEVRCLHEQTEVEHAIQRMAGEITEELSGRDPLILCVMNGGVVVFGKLLPQLPFPLQIDFLHVSRYGASTTAGDLEWKVHPQTTLRSRVVLVVDDILDEGGTLAAIMDYCRESGATAVYSAVLVEKQHVRKCKSGFKADFTGLNVEDRFLVGFGMDYQGYLRNLPGVYAVESTSTTVENNAGAQAHPDQEQLWECETKT